MSPCITFVTMILIHSAPSLKVSRTTFEDGVRYMEFTEAVARSATLGQAVDVADL